MDSADFVKAVGIAVVIIGVIILALSFIPLNSFYFSILGIVIIVIGAVWIHLVYHARFKKR